MNPRRKNNFGSGCRNSLERNPSTGSVSGSYSSGSRVNVCIVQEIQSPSSEEDDTNEVAYNVCTGGNYNVMEYSTDGRDCGCFRKNCWTINVGGNSSSGGSAGGSYEDKYGLWRHAEGCAHTNDPQIRSGRGRKGGRDRGTTDTNQFQEYRLVGSGSKSSCICSCLFTDSRGLEYDRGRNVKFSCRSLPKFFQISPRESNNFGRCRRQIDGDQGGVMRRIASWHGNWRPAGVCSQTRNTCGFRDNVFGSPYWDADRGKPFRDNVQLPDHDDTLVAGPVWASTPSIFNQREPPVQQESFPQRTTSFLGRPYFQDGPLTQPGALPTYGVDQQIVSSASISPYPEPQPSPQLEACPPCIRDSKFTQDSIQVGPLHANEYFLGGGPLSQTGSIMPSVPVTLNGSLLQSGPVQQNGFFPTNVPLTQTDSRAPNRSQIDSVPQFGNFPQGRSISRFGTFPQSGNVQIGFFPLAGAFLQTSSYPQSGQPPQSAMLYSENFSQGAGIPQQGLNRQNVFDQSVVFNRGGSGVQNRMNYPPFGLSIPCAGTPFLIIDGSAVSTLGNVPSTSGEERKSVNLSPNLPYLNKKENSCPNFRCCSEDGEKKGERSSLKSVKLNTNRNQNKEKDKNWEEKEDSNENNAPTPKPSTSKITKPPKSLGEPRSTKSSSQISPKPSGSTASSKSFESKTTSKSA